MDWLFEHIQIVILLVLAFASWLKTRLDKKLEDQDEAPPRDPTVWDDEEDDWDVPSSGPPPLDPRHPREAAPPPLVQVRPISVTPPPLPGLDKPGDLTEVLEKQKKLEEDFRRIREAKPAPPMPTLRQRKRGRTAGPGPLAKALRDQSAVRRAVVLREILGPPVGMR